MTCLIYMGIYKRGGRWTQSYEPDKLGFYMSPFVIFPLIVLVGSISVLVIGLLGILLFNTDFMPGLSYFVSSIGFIFYIYSLVCFYSTYFYSFTFKVNPVIRLLEIVYFLIISIILLVVFMTLAEFYFPVKLMFTDSGTSVIRIFFYSILTLGVLSGVFFQNNIFLRKKLSAFIEKTYFSNFVTYSVFDKDSWMDS